MLERLIRLVRRWLSATRKIQQENREIMTALETLTAQVAATISQEKSTIVFMQGLSDQIRQNANDPAALFALANELKDSMDATVAAIQANPSALPVVSDPPVPSVTPTSDPSMDATVAAIQANPSALPVVSDPPVPSVTPTSDPSIPKVPPVLPPVA